MTFSTDLVSRSAQQAADNDKPKQFADHLSRYPDISDGERTDLIRGFRELSNLDIALMLSKPDLAAKLKQFRADHKRETRRHFAITLSSLPLQ